MPGGAAVGKLGLSCLLPREPTNALVFSWTEGLEMKGRSSTGHVNVKLELVNGIVAVRGGD